VVSEVLCHASTAVLSNFLGEIGDCTYVEVQRIDD
jgi:hypothetical protein